MRQGALSQARIPPNFSDIARDCRMSARALDPYSIDVGFEASGTAFNVPTDRHG
jgi:hypothetical protein